MLGTAAEAGRPQPPSPWLEPLALPDTLGSRGAILEAQDAHGDGHIHVLHVQLPPQGAEETVQGEFGRRIGAGEGRGHAAWGRGTAAAEQPQATPTPPGSLSAPSRLH